MTDANTTYKECLDCNEEITPEEELVNPAISVPFLKGKDEAPTTCWYHRECMYRVVVGGIGHHEDHEYWCLKMGDPDGGRTSRQSALEVWAMRDKIAQDLKRAIKEIQDEQA